MHTHTWNTWTANAAAPGEQLGVRCLAQRSHLSRGQFLPELRFEPTTSGYQSNALSIGPGLPPKDCFVSNLADLSPFVSISNSAEKLYDVTETMDSLFSSTLDMVAPLHLRKIKEKSPTPWYNEHTRAP